jgi:formamidopyrimidine-DNA glycosylase
MPELPEVEATATYLREKLLGRRIVGVEVAWPRTVALVSAEQLPALVCGARIERVGRRGKFVVIELLIDGSGAFLFGHMRMSGSFDVLPQGMGADRHDRVIFDLDDGKQLRFNDPRKFGRLYFTTDPALVVGRLGPEPLEPTFSAARLRSILGASRGRIKPVLLDQHRLAGLGNIYVDEALWRSGLHPLRFARTVTLGESARLLDAIREVLGEAILHSGTDFGDGVVHGGMYRPRVYGRAGEPCERCSGEIRRIVVAQRGTHLCSKCQRRPRSARER